MAKKKGCDVKINWEMWRKKIVLASCGLILRKFVICSVQVPDLFWHLKSNMALEYCHIKKVQTETRTKSKYKTMKRWSSRRLFLLSQIWKVLQEILKSPLPVWLTGRLSLAGNSPKFNSSSASSSTQSFDELRALTGERTERSKPPSMVSNFPKPPPDSSPRNAGQCGRSNSVLLLVFFWESQIF